MKKLWILLTAMTIVLALTACADKTEEKVDKKAAGPTEEEVKAKKKALVKFNMGLVDEINGADADLNSYEGADAPEPEQKAKASESAAAVATAIKAVTIPTELTDDEKAEMEAGLKDLSDAYIAMAEELKKDAPSLDAAYGTFKQGEEKIGKIYEDNKMFKPSLSTSVN